MGQRVTVEAPKACRDNEAKGVKNVSVPLVPIRLGGLEPWPKTYFGVFLTENASDGNSFCARQHICYGAYMLSSVRLSVRPSVTRVDQSKNA